ncbi:hypothetical protein ASF45_10725 [Pseudorhodoferax sp. Leaf265]|nr:hypothetical protein [Pseudorhodoferax sp. Leaf265]KQP05010.1 hypothetical protein ASF45_10725 [Pseudorhodoferax sp. Leaf265]
MSVELAVSSMERAQPASTSSAASTGQPVCGVTAANAAMPSTLRLPATSSTRRKPKRLRMGVVTDLSARLPRK